MLGISRREPLHDEIERELRAAVRGDVLLDQVSRGLYATDASVFQMAPLAVVVPRDAADVLAALEIARRRRLKLLPRGGGTSLAGQTVLEGGLVLDFSKYMNALLETNVEERWVRVQPGIVRDELNAKIAATGLHFAPETATASRANVGGMLGNNSSGTRSVLYGKTVDHTLELDVVLADGTQLKLGPKSRAEWDAIAAKADAEGRLYRGVGAIVEREREEVKARYPKVMRRVGGYNLDEFPEEGPWNLAKLVVGSEGTLATILEAKLRLEPLPPAKIMGVVHFKKLQEGLKATQAMVATGPSMVELLDKTVLDLAKKNIETRRLCDWVQGDPAIVLVVEYFGESREEVRAKIEALWKDMGEREVGYAHLTMEDPAEQAKVMGVRLKGLGLMLGMKGDAKPTPFIEDAAVPLDVLPNYIADVLKVCQETFTPVAMYAHASVGLIHVRPILNLKLAEDVERMKTISERTFELVKKYGGSWSGEHGDGLVRSYLNERFFGERLYAAFRELKLLFDPENRMNLGKIVDAGPIDENLRMGVQYRRLQFPTQFFYREDGGFDRAVEMCTGVGECRKTLGGTMCPSYRATRDEAHSTRGRANALRLAMTGQLGLDGMTNDGVMEALDLCLACKACKSECPSNVDMAKLKVEFMSIRHEARGAARSESFYASAPRMGERFARPLLAPFVNAMSRFGPVRAGMEALLGIDRRRPLPAFAAEPFHAQFRRRIAERPAGAGRREVVLFDDTFMNYNEPRVGWAAVRALEALGYGVRLARAGCCGRTLISQGFLKEARRVGRDTLKALNRYAVQELPILVCEPSCMSALTDDLPDLIEDTQISKRVARFTHTIDGFLAAEIEEGRLDAEKVRAAFAKAPAAPSYLLHGHCHQKALHGTKAMKTVLAAIPGAKVAEIDSGCCGMAGSFGYSKSHYEVSMKVGEDRLFPAVRAMAPGTRLVAPGFSCRHQIADGAGGKAMHFVEALAEATGE